MYNKSIEQAFIIIYILGIWVEIKKDSEIMFKILNNKELYLVEIWEILAITYNFLVNLWAYSFVLWEFFK